MTTPASISKHSIHPMIIPFPIALWIFSLICDVVYALHWGGALRKDMAFFSMAGGLIGALVAAVPGYLDYRFLAGSDVQRLGRWHMATNVSIVVLFAINLWLPMAAMQAAFCRSRFRSSALLCSPCPAGLAANSSMCMVWPCSPTPPRRRQ